MALTALGSGAVAEERLERARNILCCGGDRRCRYCQPKVELVDLRIHTTSYDRYRYESV